MVKFLLGKRELIELSERLVGKESLIIKDVKFIPSSELIEVKANIKKIFSMDVNVSLRFEKVENNKVFLKMEAIKSFKIDFSKAVEKVMEARRLRRLERLGLVIEGKNLIVNSKIVFSSLGLENSEVEHIEIKDEGILINFKEVNEDKLRDLRNIG